MKNPILEEVLKQARKMPDHSSDHQIEVIDERYKRLIELSSDDRIDPLDEAFIRIIISSYMNSYSEGALTFETTIKNAWFFLDDYEERSTDSEAFDAFKDGQLSLLVSHVVTETPIKKRIPSRRTVGLLPPEIKACIPHLVDNLKTTKPSLKKVAVDEPGYTEDSNMFEYIAGRLQKWGFVNTTASSIKSIYYDNRRKKRDSGNSI